MTRCKALPRGGFCHNDAEVVLSFNDVPVPIRVCQECYDLIKNPSVFVANYGDVWFTDNLGVMYHLNSCIMIQMSPIIRADTHDAIVSEPQTNNGMDGARRRTDDNLRSVFE